MLLGVVAAKKMNPRSDFTNREKKAMKNWSEISTFRFDIYDGEARRSLHFTDPENLKLISKIEWVDG